MYTFPRALGDPHLVAESGHLEASFNKAYKGLRICKVETKAQEAGRDAARARGSNGFNGKADQGRGSSGNAQRSKSPLLRQNTMPPEVDFLVLGQPA